MIWPSALLLLVYHLPLALWYFQFLKNLPNLLLPSTIFALGSSFGLLPLLGGAAELISKALGSDCTVHLSFATLQTVGPLPCYLISW